MTLSFCLRNQKLSRPLRNAIEVFLDETRLIAAARPAVDHDDFIAKLAALQEIDPLAPENVHLSTMIKAGLRAEIARLSPPEWPAWYEAEERQRRRESDERRRSHEGLQQEQRANKRSRAPAPPSGKLSVAQAFKVLGLLDSASREDIRAAYTRIMKQLHPDVGGSDYLASLINQARAVLLDPARPHA
jgi:hypothetical protein